MDGARIRTQDVQGAQRGVAAQGGQGSVCRTRYRTRDIQLNTSGGLGALAWCVCTYYTVQYSINQLRVINPALNPPPSTLVYTQRQASTLLPSPPKGPASAL